VEGTDGIDEQEWRALCRFGMLIYHILRLEKKKLLIFFFIFDSRLLSRGPLVACLISIMMLPNFLRASAA
jgi:hypothetical protein